MIYGFITDTVFHPKSTVSLKENIPNVCYLDDNMVNYFHEHGVVTDPRTERLAYDNQSISGTIQFHFDTSKQEDPTIFSSKITTEEYENCLVFLKISILPILNHWLRLSLFFPQILIGKMYMLQNH